MLAVDIKKQLPGFNLEVSFNISNEILSLVGPSGSGKSMTLQCISGLLKPDTGHICLNNRVLFDSAAKINIPPQKRRIGYLFQNYTLFPHMTVYENVAFGISHLEQKEIKQRVNDLLAKMRLSGFERRYPAQLSGGQQQRVALARALAPEPELLLLDEPFSALDTQVKRKLEDEIINIQRFYQGNVIFVTHNLEEAYRLSSQIAVYDNGSILQVGAKQDLISAPADRQVARLTGVKNLMSGIIKELDTAGATALVWVPKLGGQLRVSLKKPLAGSQNQLSENQEIVVGIRPEYIQITDQPGENAFCGIINKAIDGVASYTYHVQLDGNSSAKNYHLEAQVSKITAPWMPVGQTCYLYLMPEQLFLTQ